MTSCIFDTNSWFNTCCKIHICITYFSLPCKLAASCLTYSIFILSGKKEKSLWKLCRFSRYCTSASRKYFFINPFIASFYKTFTKFRNIFNPFKIIIAILKIRQLFIFIIIFHVFVIISWISINSETFLLWYILKTINNMLISVKRSNFTLTFFKATCQANRGLRENE